MRIKSQVLLAGLILTASATALTLPSEMSLLTSLQQLKIEGSETKSLTLTTEAKKKHAAVFTHNLQGLDITSLDIGDLRANWKADLSIERYRLVIRSSYNALVVHPLDVTDYKLFINNDVKAGVIDTRIKADMITGAPQILLFSRIAPIGKINDLSESRKCQVDKGKMTCQYQQSYGSVDAWDEANRKYERVSEDLDFSVKYTFNYADFVGYLRASADKGKLTKGSPTHKQAVNAQVEKLFKAGFSVTDGRYKGKILFGEIDASFAFDIGYDADAHKLMIKNGYADIVLSPTQMQQLLKISMTLKSDGNDFQVLNESDLRVIKKWYDRGYFVKSGDHYEVKVKVSDGVVSVNGHVIDKDDAHTADELLKYARLFLGYQVLMPQGDAMRD